MEDGIRAMFLMVSCPFYDDFYNGTSQYFIIYHIMPTMFIPNAIITSVNVHRTYKILTHRYIQKLKKKILNQIFLHSRMGAKDIKIEIVNVPAAKIYGSLSFSKSAKTSV